MFTYRELDFSAVCYCMYMVNTKSDLHLTGLSPNLTHRPGGGAVMSGWWGCYVRVVGLLCPGGGAVMSGWWGCYVRVVGLLCPGGGAVMFGW